VPSSRHHAAHSLAALALIAGSVFSLHPASAGAQPRNQPAASPSAKPASSTTQSIVDRHAARVVMRTALINLRMNDDPTPEDYLIASEVMAVASALTPADPEIVRRRIEAEWNAGRTDRVLELTRDLVRLDPKDTVAQLRLITATINEKQTAAERLAMYDRFLGKAGRSIDDSVRSRLALDASLLARDAGNDETFRKYLLQSLSLDSSNKEAALLALTTEQLKPDFDRTNRAELLSNLLMADPLDSHIHMTLAAEFARAGIFDVASRLHQNALIIMNRAGVIPPATTEVEALSLEWHTLGPKAVADRLTRSIEKQRDNVRKYNERVRTGFGVGEDIGEPEDVRLNTESEKIRLAAAVVLKDTTLAAASILDMNRSVEFMLGLINDDKKRPLGMTPESAADQAFAALLDLQFWRVLSGLELDKVEADLKRYDEHAKEDQPGPALVRAILAVRQGDLAAALPQLDAAEERIDFRSSVRVTATYARALAMLQQDKKEEAVSLFRTVTRDMPMSPLGVMSRSQLEEITGSPEFVGVGRDRVLQIAKGIPDWIDKMIREPKSVVTLMADLPPTSSFTDPPPLRITLRSMAPIPLALGSERPLNSRLLLSPNFAIRSAGLNSQIRPEAADLDRRLRLLPRESLEIPLPIDWGMSGLVAELACDQQQRIRWRLLQGAVADRTGRFTAGPFGITTESLSSSRPALEQHFLPPSTIAKDLATASGTDLVALVIAANRILWAETLESLAPQPSPRQATPPSDSTSTPAEDPATQAAPLAESKKADHAATRSALVDAIAKLYPSLSREARIMIAAALPHAGQYPEMAPLDAAIRDDADPSLRVIALVTRVKQTDDPLIANARDDADPRLKGLAEVLLTRLADPRKTIARVGPGFAELRGEQDPATR